MRIFASHVGLTSVKYINIGLACFLFNNYKLNWIISRVSTGKIFSQDFSGNVKVCKIQNLKDLKWVC